MKRFLLLTAIATLAAFGCSSSSSPNAAGRNGKKATTTTQSLKGKAPTSGAKKATHVTARKLAAKGKKHETVRAPVAADGSFQLDLPRGAQYTVVFQADQEAIGTLKYPSGGSSTHVLSISEYIVSSDGSEAFDFGNVSLSGEVLSAEHNALAFMDWDGDGIADSEDNDDDGDGTPDATDDDDDGDGVADADEDDDTDGDGIIDLLDDDDDGDGTPDKDDDDDDNDGTADKDDDDDDDDGIADGDDDDDDNDGIPDSEDDDDDGDGIPDANEG